PFTTKDDVRKYYPYGMFAVPMEDVVRVHSSSGTTGKPTVIGYTQSDIQMWAGTIARTLCGGGAVRGDVLHNAYGYGMFTGGLGLHYGGELLGLTVLPLSGGNTKRQILIMQDFGSTLISCTPSYALRLAEVAEAEGVDMTALPLRSGYMGAEPWSEAMRQKIEARTGFTTYNIYGLSEVIGPGVSFECEEQNGSHINSDHFIPEVIDPETKEVLPDGQYGELVFTCPTKQCLPLVRYRTGDICSLDHTPCPCGRTTARMSLVTGRTDDMLIVRGVNVFPSQIEEIIVGFPELEPYYQIVVDREGTLDELEVHVEVAPDYFADRVGELEAVRRRVTEETQSALGVSVQIHLAEPQSLARSEGKAAHVVDKRDFNK
ncbi:MAG: phenylacetate--CoA ligase, partial [Armatimonadetes bacterium]|nr:phenylacetate--CoA ligase [Armatimonadota bacterium]